MTAKELQNHIPMQLQCFHTCCDEPVIVLDFGVGFPQITRCPSCNELASYEDLTYSTVVKNNV